MSGYVSGGRHRFVAEQALGKQLPRGAEVHHVNGLKSDNRNTNLIICQDRAYHALLELRTRAYRACGHADFRRCKGCKQWMSPADMASHYAECRRAYERRLWHVKHGDPSINRCRARRGQWARLGPDARATVVANMRLAQAIGAARRSSVGTSRELGLRAWAARVTKDHKVMHEEALTVLRRLRAHGWTLRRIRDGIRRLTSLPLSQGTVCVWVNGKRKPHLDYLVRVTAAVRILAGEECGEEQQPCGG